MSSNCGCNPLVMQRHSLHLDELPNDAECRARLRDGCHNELDVPATRLSQHHITSAAQPEAIHYCAARLALRDR